jgi:hypothetical protein
LPPDPFSRLRLLTRLEKRMEVLQWVKLDGFQMVISELEVEMDYLRRAKRYLEEWAARARFIGVPAASVQKFTLRESAHL